MPPPPRCAPASSLRFNSKSNCTRAKMATLNRASVLTEHTNLLFCFVPLNPTPVWIKRAVIQYGLIRYAGSLGQPRARKNTPLTQKLSNSLLVMRFGCPTTVTPSTLSSSCCRFVIKSGRHRACNKVLQLSKCQRKCSCNYADARMH